MRLEEVLQKRGLEAATSPYILFYERTELLLFSEKRFLEVLLKVGSIRPLGPSRTSRTSEPIILRG